MITLKIDKRTFEELENRADHCEDSASNCREEENEEGAQSWEATAHAIRCSLVKDGRGYMLRVASTSYAEDIAGEAANIAAIIRDGANWTSVLAPEKARMLRDARKFERVADALTLFSREQ